MIRFLTHPFRRFTGRQDGAASLELVLLFPGLMSIFLMGFEAGYYMVRNVMLERGVDLAIRDVRLGGDGSPSYKEIKATICAHATILVDCENSVQVEMRAVPRGPGGIASLGNTWRCIDKGSDEDAADYTTYETGYDNELMLVRVCALSKPLFPTSALGVRMKADEEGNYAIVATASFVHEPNAVTTSNGGS